MQGSSLQLWSFSCVSILHIGSEVMSGSVASSHRTALLVLKGREDSEEDKEAGVEDWRKQI